MAGILFSLLFIAFPLRAARAAEPSSSQSAASLKERADRLLQQLREANAAKNRAAIDRLKLELQQLKSEHAQAGSRDETVGRTLVEADLLVQSSASAPVERSRTDPDDLTAARGVVSEDGALGGFDGDTRKPATEGPSSLSAEPAAPGKPSDFIEKKTEADGSTSFHVKIGKALDGVEGEKQKNRRLLELSTELLKQMKRPKDDTQVKTLAQWFKTILKDTPAERHKTLSIVADGKGKLWRHYVGADGNPVREATKHHLSKLPSSRAGSRGGSLGDENKPPAEGKGDLNGGGGGKVGGGGGKGGKGPKFGGNKGGDGNLSPKTKDTMKGGKNRALGDLSPKKGGPMGGAPNAADATPKVKGAGAIPGAASPAADAKKAAKPGGAKGGDLAPGGNSGKSAGRGKKAGSGGKSADAGGMAGGGAKVAGKRGSGGRGGGSWGGGDFSGDVGGEYMPGKGKRGAAGGKGKKGKSSMDYEDSPWGGEPSVRDRAGGATKGGFGGKKGKKDKQGGGRVDAGDQGQPDTAKAPGKKSGAREPGTSKTKIDKSKASAPSAAAKKQKGTPDAKPTDKTKKPPLLPLPSDAELDRLIRKVNSPRPPTAGPRGLRDAPASVSPSMKKPKKPSNVPSAPKYKTKSPPSAKSAAKKSAPKKDDGQLPLTVGTGASSAPSGEAKTPPASNTPIPAPADVP